MAKQAFSMKMSGDIAAQLKAYQAEVRATFREAAFAAATVFYDEMQNTVPEVTGTLKQAIYRYREVDKSKDGVEVFSVGVNVVKAPHWHFLEYGTRRQAAQPFLRPAYDKKSGEANKAATETMRKRLAK